MKSSFFLLTGCGLMFLAAISLVQAKDPVQDSAPKKDAAIKPVAAAAAAKPAKTQTPVALTLEAIQELEERKNALDLRERLLDERKQELDLQEKLLKEKLAKIEALNQKMAEKLDGFTKEHDQKITKLVTVVETMRPQAAAEYVENLDPELAVQILTRIQVAKAAKILNLVNKKQSAQLTELYTGYRQTMEKPGDRAPAAAKEVPEANKKM